MSKEAFLATLRSSLAGKIPANMIEENVRYYEQYIESQIRMGKTEQQIMDELGNPRLIAKTICEANKHAERQGEYGGNNQSYTYSESGQPKPKKNFWGWFFSLPKWVHTIVLILILALVLFLFATIVSALFPLIAALIVIGFVVKLFRRDGFW